MHAPPPPQTARAVLAAGLRTPFSPSGGPLRREDAAHLGAAAVRELLARTGLDPALLDEVIAGCAAPPHDLPNVARVIALRAGVPASVPARTVSRSCASGMDAVCTAVALVESGRASAVLCAGVEVASAWPLVLERELTERLDELRRAAGVPERLRALSRLRLRHLLPRPMAIGLLAEPSLGFAAARTDERLAREFGVTREAADLCAEQSHRRARAARDCGRLGSEIVPLLPPGAAASIAFDSGIGNGALAGRLPRMAPAFEPDGVVTRGNACATGDGAVALLVTSRARASELGLGPLAEVRSFAFAGLDPARAGLALVLAASRALDLGGCKLEDVGVIELHEASGAQSLACRRAFESRAFAERELGRPRALGELDPARTNKNGGAIALGHPAGASGARLCLTAALELAQLPCELALAATSAGGGQGAAVLLQRSGT